MLKTSFEKYDLVQEEIENDIQDYVVGRIPVVSFLPTTEQLDGIKELKLPNYEEFVMWLLTALDTIEEETLEIKRLKSWLNMELCDRLILVEEDEL